MPLMTSRAFGTLMPASLIASRFRCALSRICSWSAVVAKESINVMTPHSSSSMWKSAAVNTGTSLPRDRKTSARTRIMSRDPCAAAAIMMLSSSSEINSGE